VSHTPSHTPSHTLSRAVDTVLDRSVVLGYSTIGLGVRRHLASWPGDPAPGALTGRQVLVTGASSGLGTATAEGLARLGAEVHLVVRDLDKGARVEGELREAVPEASFRLWRCDVGDLDDVRRFAGEAAASGLTFAGIVHNAGVMPPERTESAQGHELTMSLHVLGPVLMTERLRPALADGARVVLVTSGGMYAQALRDDDPDYVDGEYSPTTAYARSKRAQVELVPLLEGAWGGLHVYATHPGWADTPGVQESLPTFRRLTRPFLRDAEGGADTTVWLCAVQPPPPGAGVWHDRRARPTSLLPGTRPTDEQRERIWAWVRRETGLG
jgi:NAD(P)-dependent dehydrogenase (short-subunit alcohol dehydrogenase family)